MDRRAIRRVFEAARLCCKADGADVPEVQAIIALLLPILVRSWRRLVDSLATEIEHQMRELSTRGTKPSDLALLLAAFVTRLERIVRDPLPRAADLAIEEATATLIRDAARLSGFAEPQVGVSAQSLGLRQLETMLSQQAAQSIEDAADVASRFLQDDLGHGTTQEALQAWREELRAALDAEQVLLPMLDVWSYQTFNMAAVRAAADAGENFIMLQALIDDHTTQFCRLVNGRVIPMARALRQLDQIQSAVLAGDAAALISAAPFVSDPEHATQAEVDAVLAVGGLAPFHFGCRTRNVPVRIP